ncbi:MAG TPA: hypothetical protein PKJ41_03795 [Bryobacteraceae bacterium]|nr:hypothetical protein [Bryobacteraceae bacterium]HPT26940.1 hypothetical protein [Bryobacteraceae bacterium]
MTLANRAFDARQAVRRNLRRILDALYPRIAQLEKDGAFWKYRTRELERDTAWWHGVRNVGPYAMLESLHSSHENAMSLMRHSDAMLKLEQQYTQTLKEQLESAKAERDQLRYDIEGLREQDTARAALYESVCLKLRRMEVQFASYGNDVIETVQNPPCSEVADDAA